MTVHRLTFEQARTLAERRLTVNVQEFPEMKGKEVLLDEYFIASARFWVFFWKKEIEVPRGLYRLGAGFGCLINDRGEMRDIIDLRLRPDQFEQTLRDMAAWAGRPE